MRVKIDRLGKVSITVDKNPWDISKDYDKLVMVRTSDTNSAYLSRKPVPAGTNILNREYWFPFREINVIDDLGDSSSAAISQKAVTEKLNELFETTKNVEEELTRKSNIHVGKFNAGKIKDEEGWYDEVTYGRPEDSDDDEAYLLYNSSTGVQICFSKKYSSKAYHRINTDDPWTPLNKNDFKSNIHTGEFNAGTVTEEGWYDNIVYGRPEGCESNEYYLMYQSPNGTQICYSKKNAGVAFHRPDKDHYWMPVTRDNYTIEHSLSSSVNTYKLVETLDYTKLKNVVTNNCEVSQVTAYKTVSAIPTDTVNSRVRFRIDPIELQPNDIVRVRCFYRKGNSTQGINEYKYDSNAYVYLSNTNTDDRSIDALIGDYIKVKSLGSFYDKALTGIDSVRSNLFTDNTEYGWHYLKVNKQAAVNGYLQIVVNFDTINSWFVFDKIEIYRKTEVYNISEIDKTISDIKKEHKEFEDKTENTLALKADLVGGKVPESQLPSYVDDVIEFAKEVDGVDWKTEAIATEIGTVVYCSASPTNAGEYYHKFVKNTDGTIEGLAIIEPEFGKIYVNLSNNNTYRWSGSNIVEISKSLAIGETASTAFAGNRGKTLEGNMADILKRMLLIEENPFANLAINTPIIFADEIQQVKATLTFSTKSGKELSSIAMSIAGTTLDANDITTNFNQYVGTKNIYLTSGTYKVIVNGVYKLKVENDYETTEVEGTVNKEGTFTVVDPIYYGFGFSPTSLNYFQKASVETNPKSIYTGTSAVDNQYFFIFIPTSRDTLNVDNFTMGGAPVAMNVQKNIQIDNKAYNIYYTQTSYKAGTALSIVTY